MMTMDGYIDFSFIYPFLFHLEFFDYQLLIDLSSPFEIKFL